MMVDLGSRERELRNSMHHLNDEVSLVMTKNYQLLMTDLSTRLYDELTSLGFCIIVKQHDITNSLSVVVEFETVVHSTSR